MIETQTRGKRTIDRGLQGSVGTLADANPTRLSKQSQGCPLTLTAQTGLAHVCANHIPAYAKASEEEYHVQN